MSPAQKRFLKVYNFKSIDEYYQYIIESKINGQNSQVIALFINMPRSNRKDFLQYLAEEVERENNGNTVYFELLKYCIDLIY